MQEATWRDLSYLESRDLATGLFREVHGREPSAARSHSIVAAFGQGRRYFEAADHADLLVRPPLLLYGVIALSRGLTLFLDPETLGPTTTSTEPLRRLPDLRASFGRGTFTDLLAVTRNVERARVVVQPPDESLEWSSEGTQDVEGLTITFGDVLSRLPDLAVSYARTFGRRRRCYPARVTYRKLQQETEIQILPTTFLGLPTEEEVRGAFTLPPWIPVVQQPFRSVLQPGRTAVTFVIPHPNEADLEAIPSVVETADGRTSSCLTRLGNRDSRCYSPST